MKSSPQIDFDFMQRAIRLAMQGRGSVEPNPMVGCVIINEARVIGQGYHQKYGQSHAEPNALAVCTESPEGATAYVTLEPCCHLGKQTPPCVPRLIEARVSRVVVACMDPNPQVAGKGIAQLRAAGIQVDYGICESEAKQLAAPFFIRMAGERARPYITLKWAQTADGKIAGPEGARLQISNESSTRAVHQLRSRCDAILVGINTVIADDPSLTARDVPRTRPLHRLILDTHLRTPVTSKLAQSARQIPVRIFCSELLVHTEKANVLKASGIEITGVSTIQPGLLGLEQMLRHLSPDRITHLLVEPGPTLATRFFQDGWVDRLWVNRSTKTVDDPTAPTAATVPADYVQTGQIELAGDTLTEYLNPRSPVFFANVPSADFLSNQTLG